MIKQRLLFLFGIPLMAWVLPVLAQTPFPDNPATAGTPVVPVVPMVERPLLIPPAAAEKSEAPEKAEVATPAAPAPIVAPAPAPVPEQPAAAKPPAPRLLPPVDEGAGDPSWVQFRASLMDILQRGDRRALGNVVDANVLNPLETPRGIAAFRKMWDLDGNDAQLSRELMAALQMGSAWYQPKGSQRLLCVPYVPIKWPLDDYDPYSSGVIVVRDALVKSAPSNNADTVARLTYDIVDVSDWEVADSDSRVPQHWVKIETGGRPGYVPEEHIRSAIEHRACFGKTNAGWRLMEYVLGIEYLGD